MNHPITPSLTVSPLSGPALADRRDELLELVRAADEEFVPPLSSRGGTTDTDLSDGADRDIEPYFAQMTAQSLIAAVDKVGRVAGILSYIPDRILDNGDEEVASDYVSTIIVGTDHRRRGVARSLCRELMTRETPISTRTWSGNTEHLELLADLGFVLWKRLPDDRGLGVDTVYYLRR